MTTRTSKSVSKAHANSQDASIFRSFAHGSTEHAGQVQRMPRLHGPALLPSVVSWELRRVCSSRTVWVIACLVVLFFSVLTASQQRAHDLTFGWTVDSLTENGGYDAGNMIHVVIAGTSGWGMIQTIPRLLLPALGLCIPFMTADLVARDFKVRTYGIVLSAPVPTWAYLLGRYLAGMILSLAVALSMLVAIEIVGVLHSFSGDSLPDSYAMLAIWAVAVLPAVVFLSGLSFGLSTLLPRQSNFVKIIVLTGWFLSTLTPLFLGGTPVTESDSVAVWDPTGSLMSLNIEGQYNRRFSEILNFRGATEPVTDLIRARAAQVAQQVEREVPDLWPWVVPRLGYASLGVAAVLLAMTRFRRFRNL